MSPDRKPVQDRRDQPACRDHEEGLSVRDRPDQSACRPDHEDEGRPVRDRSSGELAYRIDRARAERGRGWDLVAFVDDLAIARAAFARIVELHPEERWTLRVGARVILEHPEPAWG